MSDTELPVETLPVDETAQEDTAEITAAADPTESELPTPLMLVAEPSIVFNPQKPGSEGGTAG